MHIKWNVRHYAGKSRSDYLGHAVPGTTSTYREAVLVRSVRVNGKPRHQTIARLGSFNERGLTQYPAHVRATFWRDVDTVLYGPVTARTWSFKTAGQERARMAVAALDLDAAAYAALEAKIAAVIPRPER